MTKPAVVDHRYDFRGGINTAISPDLLNKNELVDATNARISASYGGISKRTGSQRIHQTAFPNKVDGVTQWDSPNGKQVVVISDGKLWYRNGFDYGTAFTSVNPPGTLRSTNNGTDAAKAWSGGASGVNALSRTTPGQSVVAAGSRLLCKLGDPNQTPNSNIPSTDNNYTLTGFKLNVNALSVTGSNGFFSSGVTFEASTDGGGSWFSVGTSYSVSCGVGQQQTTEFGPITFLIGSGAAQVWVRAIYTLTAQYEGWSGTVNGQFQVFSTAWQTDNYTFSWITGAGALLGSPVTWMPFRGATSGAPLVLYFSSNNHYWSWNGTGTLTLLDPTNNAPPAYTIASYHTRAFATTQTQPKHLFWSRIGDATFFTTGTKTDGGSALCDYLTGNALIAMEVIGSSLLLATTEAILRFTGHASDDIVIAQDTEGITTDVGIVGPLALRRYENVCGFMSNRGPYAATETYVQPIGEALNPNWFGLDKANLGASVVEYHRDRKELWFAVPGPNDGGLNKTVYVQSTRLQAWQGPWVYPFDIACVGKYTDVSGSANLIAGSNDGFIRLLDVQNPTLRTAKDDVLYDGTSGSNITMQLELPVLHFEIPGIKKALTSVALQADLPIGASFEINLAFDGGSFNTFPVPANNNGEQNYRVDVNGQGFRPRMQLVEDSEQLPTLFGISTYGYNYLRST